ncbi:unnamed protein product [Rhizoctonia solani]|uniref:AC transposase n=1 Tax=Rhizoctonia solani TaxID=456999 RepID=A0A8H3E057_9AGAM|nr:unnamed protein product [Rhizoctonia solani]
MKKHMKEKHSAIWTAADRFDKVMLGAQDNTEASFNIDEFYKKLARWIVTGNQPFTEIENKELRDMIIYLRPALGDHLIQSAALKERLFGHAEIMPITGSWVTLDWERQETLLDFVELRGAHSGENMADLIGKTLAELGIVNQVVALVSDSASNNGTLVRHLSNQLQRSSPNSRWDGTKGHIRCLAHVIHLAVMSLLRALHAVPESVNTRDFDYNDKDLTEETAEAVVADNNQESLESDDTDLADPLVNLHSGISKIRKITKIVRSSPQRMELFRTIAERIEDRNEQTTRAENQPYKKKVVKTLILDVVTRWNSMLLMLERGLEFREAIDLLTVHPQVKIYRPYGLTSDDWVSVSQACTWLKFFRDASLYISGEKYPTLSFSLQIYFILIQYVTRLEEDSAIMRSPVTLRGLKACKGKLVEYFDKSTYDSEYYYFAMVLDPRYKDTLFKANSDMIEELFSANWIADCANALVQTCQEFYSLSLDGSETESKPQRPEIVDFNSFSNAFRASVPQRTGRPFNSRSEHPWLLSVSYL